MNAYYWQLRREYVPAFLAFQYARLCRLPSDATLRAIRVTCLAPRDRKNTKGVNRK